MDDILVDLGMFLIFFIFSINEYACQRDHMLSKFYVRWLEKFFFLNIENMVLNKNNNINISHLLN